MSIVNNKFKNDLEKIKNKEKINDVLLDFFSNIKTPFKKIYKNYVYVENVSVKQFLPILKNTLECNGMDKDKNVNFTEILKYNKKYEDSMFKIIFNLDKKEINDLLLNNFFQNNDLNNKNIIKLFDINKSFVLKNVNNLDCVLEKLIDDDFVNIKTNKNMEINFFKNYLTKLKTENKNENIEELFSTQTLEYIPLDLELLNENWKYINKNKLFFLRKNKNLNKKMLTFISQQISDEEYIKFLNILDYNINIEDFGFLKNHIYDLNKDNIVDNISKNYEKNTNIEKIQNLFLDLNEYAGKEILEELNNSDNLNLDFYIKCFKNLKQELNENDYFNYINKSTSSEYIELLCKKLLQKEKRGGSVDLTNNELQKIICFISQSNIENNNLKKQLFEYYKKYKSIKEHLIANQDVSFMLNQEELFKDLHIDDTVLLYKSAKNKNDVDIIDNYIKNKLNENISSKNYKLKSDIQKKEILLKNYEYIKSLTTEEKTSLLSKDVLNNYEENLNVIVSIISKKEELCNVKINKKLNNDYGISL